MKLPTWLFRQRPRKTSAASRPAQPRGQRWRYLPLVEGLEDRLVLDTLFWTGATGLADWTAAVAGTTNWSLNADGSDSTAVIQDGDDLVFNTVATVPGNFTSTNDGVITVVNTITFEGNGSYLINGSGFTLDAGITSNSSNGTTNTINNAITLGAAQTFTVTTAGETVVLDNSIDLDGNNLAFDGAGTLRIDAAISGSGDLTQSGTGSTELNGANSFTGAVNINAGSVIVGDDAGLGNGANQVTVADGAALGLQNNAGQVVSIVNPLSITGAGGVNGGALFNADNSLVTYGGPIDLQGNTTFFGGTSNTAALTITGPISGTGALNLDGTNDAQIILANPNLVPNNFVGDTTVETGVAVTLNNGDVAIPGNLIIQTGASVTLAQNNQIADTGAVTVDGLLDMTGITETIFGLSGNGTVDIEQGQLTIDNNIAFPFEFDGTIIGANGNLRKTGSGEFTLNGDNTYSGITEIDNGTLLINGTTSSSTFQISNGTLGGGVGATAGTIGPINATGGFIAPGNTGLDFLGILNVEGDSTFNQFTVFVAELGGTIPGTEMDQLNVTGILDLGTAVLQANFVNNFNPNVGDVFTIIQTTGGVTGIFNGLNEGDILNVGGRAMRISYLNNNVTLEAVQVETQTTLDPGFPNPSTQGQLVIFQATVTSTFAVPTGIVEFFAGAMLLGSAILNENGVATFTTTNLPSGTLSITARYLESENFAASTSAPQIQTVIPAVPAASPIFAVGAGPGGAPNVNVYDASGQLIASFLAFDAGFRGGVTVAVGDVNGDGVNDIIVGAGPGANPHVRVFSGVNFTPLEGALGSFFAFDAGFRGGVNVAAGDVNGDGFADIIVGAGPGANPHVVVFSGQTGALLASFFAYDAGFRGGVHVAAGPVLGNGRAQIITGAGAGANPDVRVFDILISLSPLFNFMAYDIGFRGGVFVAVGDVDGNGIADIITGAGAGANPDVRIFDGGGNFQRQLFPFAMSFRGGVRVATVDRGDGIARIVAGAGPGAEPHITTFDGLTLNLIDSFFAFDEAFRGGVFTG
ncbi:MAG: beta strand repeat-containing protein [Gemmataceae bacterium]